MPPIRVSSGIIGPSTSGDAEASAQTYYHAGIAQISPSATDIPLTYTVNGKKLGTPAFFRDVPANNIEGPSIAAYITNNLKAKNVVVFDFQEPYSQGLASSISGYLTKHSVNVSHALGAEHHDGLLGVRHEGAEQHRRRRVPHAAAAGGADVRRAARGAGQEGRRVRR